MAVSTTTVLDVPTLVAQLMSIERQPIDKLQAKVTTNDSKISAFGSIKSLVSTFQSAVSGLSTSLTKYSASASDSTAFSASASSSAVAGNYTLSVSHLATAQNLVAAGQTSSSTGLTTTSSTLTFVVGGNATDISIDAGASLEDIRNAINEADIGISATIVNDGSGTPYRLALSASKTGTANAVDSITVQSGGDSALNQLLAFNPTSNAPATATLTQTTTAQNASFSVNGIPITSASNTVADAIQGVTLTLKAETTSATLSIDRDTSSMVDAASAMVEAYNTMVKQLKTTSAYATSASATAPALSGDSTVRSMLDQVRGILSTAASGGTYSYLVEIGISQQADGTLQLDSSKFNEAVSTRFSDVENLLNGASGFATRFDAWASSTLNTGGLIDTRLGTINASTDSINEQIEKLEARMTQIELQYTITYSNLNTYLASMDALSTYLTSQTSAWFQSSK